ncbi:MAG TPA: hypothetical protein VFI31_06105 [Pirellulales bacterium]|nr:hypothetical protein [Pirellulales bacterium]
MPQQSAKRETRHGALRVVKLGGSLLDCADLTNRLREWLASELLFSNVLVVGGGRRADLVRARTHRFTDREAHWLAIEAMEENARAVAGLVPEAVWLDRLDRLPTTGGQVYVLSPLSFMKNDDPCHPEGPLPECWSVTSDSIAARAAELCQADELVLLKSALPPPGESPAELATIGYVDAYFPRASRKLPRVCYVDLRNWQCCGQGQSSKIK